MLVGRYKLVIDELTTLNGGYRSDETFLLVTEERKKYVVKYIRYHFSAQFLRTVLKFENFLQDAHAYPCAQILLTDDEEVLVVDGDRLLFVQVFIEGVEPTREIIDRDDGYLNRLGRLLAQWRCASRQFGLPDGLPVEYEEFTQDWWEEQAVQIADPFLLASFLECKHALAGRDNTFERGLAHNDLHTNNTILTAEGKIFVIDLVDALPSLFVADLATSLFNLLLDETNGEQRVRAFLHGYQQLVPLPSNEMENLDAFVRLKLTLSIVYDLRHSDDPNEPFMQACFDLLRQLRANPTRVKNLL